MKKCYYQVLEVDRKVAPGDLKTAFRKQALKWHPDKNPSPDATEIFQRINQAYSVLSDPQERKWYDDHRQQILMGTELGSEAASYIIADNLFKYFSTSIFKNNYSDEKGGFFDVFGTLFHTLDQEEDAAVYARTKNPESDDEEEESYQKMPHFGNSKADPADVRNFYNDWLDFHSRKKFAFMDKYNPNEGPNRKIKRLIVQENLKERMKEKKKLNEAVRSLVAWVQKRDPRWKEIQRLRKEEQEMKEEVKKKQREEAKQAKKEARKKAMEEQAQRLDQAEEERLIRGYEEELAMEKMKRKLKKGKKLGVEEWKAEEDDWISSKKSKQQTIFKNKKKWKEAKQQAEKTAEILEKSDDENQEQLKEEEAPQVEEEPDEFVCEPCDKVFKSKEQLKNHFESKKHKRNVREIMKELKLSQEEFNNEKQTEVAKEEDEPEREETKEEIKNSKNPDKKKKKKMQKKQKNWALLHQDLDSSQSSTDQEQKSGDEKGNSDKDEILEQEQTKEESSYKAENESTSSKKEEGEQEPEDTGLKALPGEEEKESGKGKKKSKRKVNKLEKEQEEKEEEKEKSEGSEEETPYEQLSKKEKRKLKQKAKESLAEWVCNVCAKQFETRNALFKHLKQKGHERAVPDAPADVEVDEDFGLKRGKKKKNKKF